MKLGPWPGALVALALSGVAAAQDSGPSLNIQHFAPVGGNQGFALTPTARALKQLQPAVDLYGNYAYRPFNRSIDVGGKLVRQDGAVENLTAFHLRAGLGATDWLEVALNMPVAQLPGAGTAIEAYGGAAQSFSVGDLSAELRFVPLNEEAPVGIFIAPFVSFPTGNRAVFLTHGVVTAGATAGISKTISVVQFSGYGGYRVKPQSASLDELLAIDDEVLYGAGIGFQIVPEWFRINAELYGSTIVGPGRKLISEDTFNNALHSPLELIGDFRVDTPVGVHITAGAGPGLTAAAGTPAFRAFLGLGWSPKTDNDRDGDGILNKVDGCPDDPEDFDEFEDEDGCPDEDNDQDKILDVRDDCPDEPEDYDDFQDDDGCPEPDNDLDGIPDKKDECPLIPEDFDGVDDQDGCPDAEYDYDGDGYMADKDKCPYDPEDFDNFEDFDGCPDRDNDQDKILDVDDKCPMEPEVYNQVNDEDGCPDDQLVVLEKGRIVILEKIYFEYGKDVILPKSYPVLYAVAKTLTEHPELLKVRVEGHTDSKGSDSYNQQLSEKRAKAIVKFLVLEAAIEPQRLEFVGWGEAQPIAPNDNEENMERNRRVEFIIVDPP